MTTHPFLRSVTGYALIILIAAAIAALSSITEVL